MVLGGHRGRTPLLLLTVVAVAVSVSLHTWQHQTGQVGMGQASRLVGGEFIHHRTSQQAGGWGARTERRYHTGWMVAGCLAKMTTQPMNVGVARHAPPPTWSVSVLPCATPHLVSQCAAMRHPPPGQSVCCHAPPTTWSVSVLALFNFDKKTSPPRYLNPTFAACWYCPAGPPILPSPTPR